jgi:hypothetical protein
MYTGVTRERLVVVPSYNTRRRLRTDVSSDETFIPGTSDYRKGAQTRVII